MREADIHIPHDVIAAMGVSIPPEHSHEANVRELSVLCCTEMGSIVAAQYSEPVDAMLDDADHIEWWDRHESNGEGVTYLYEAVVPDLPAGLPNITETTLGIDSVSMAADGCTVTLVGDQDAISCWAAACEDVDSSATVPLRRLADYETADSVLDSLTSRQREVLETAHAIGYFEVPHQATAADVTHRLDVDRATVTEHLQRAERTLVSSILSG